jgi:predicted extracellular nuclease
MFRTQKTPTTLTLLALALAWCICCFHAPSVQADTPNLDGPVSTVGNGNKLPIKKSATTSATAVNQQRDKPIRIDGDLSIIDWNSMVGRKVIIKGDLVIVDTYDLLRYGQVKVARERLYVPTSRIDPNDKNPNGTSFQGGNNVAEVVAAQKFNDKATLIIDDGRAKQNIFPPLLFPELGKKLPSVRTGSVINGVSGKIIKAGRNLLLVPDNKLRWTPDQRPDRPDVGKADTTVASFNVLNYFTTIDNGKNNARGADNKAEFARQEAKIVAAIIALDADVTGLMELENGLEAEKRLVEALNQKFGKRVFTGSGLPKNFQDAPGGKDDIRVGIIYRSDRVEPVGSVAMIQDEAFFGARTPIVQSFKPKGTGKPFSVIVNHFKSKGGANRAEKADKNKGDGQGAYNAKRRGQALAICNFIEENSRGNQQPRVLVIGDLNAYEQEDPIDALRANGLVDLHELVGKNDNQAQAPKSYSYVYRGQAGSLDHAFGTKSLAKDVTGVAVWNINADEPRSMDYNQEFKPKELFKPDPFRSSDHDPVLIGIKN